jgi:hypothetical protein
MTAPSARSIVLVGLLGSLTIYAWRSLATQPPAVFPPSAGSDSAQLSVVVVARTEDCTRALSFLDILDRTTLRKRIARPHLMVAGRAADTVAIRATLTQLGIIGDMSLLSRRARVTLSLAGLRETPALLLYRRDGSLILSTRAPMTVDEYVAVGVMLEAIVAREAN